MITLLLKLSSMIKKTNNSFYWLLHVLFWIAIVLWRAKGDYYGGVDIYCFIIHNAIRLPPVIIGTYVLAYFLLPKYFILEKNYLVFSVFFFINYFITFYLESLIISSSLMSNFLPPESIAIGWFKDLHPFRNAFSLFSIMGILSLVQFFKLHLSEEKKRNLLQEENLKTKLDFLKAQVNPHFLFNALNNIYSMAIQNDQKEIAESLDSLSGIMKYLSYDSNKELVPLKKEILLLQNYIEIQHLRLTSSDEVLISFNIEGSVRNEMIAPVILLPLVENGFKHGIRLNEECLVSIKLDIKNDFLNFRMKNTLFKEKKLNAIEKGIGIENVRNRLALLYPGDFELSLKEEGKYFISNLALKLNNIG